LQVACWAVCQKQCFALCSNSNNDKNQCCTRPFFNNNTTGQEYAQVVKMLGNGRCDCFCFDGVSRLGHIRGKMRKKVWITAGDIVLVGKREFQDEKVDIIHKYTADEARNLKQYGELPDNARINETAVDIANAMDNDSDDDLGIDFDDL
jgi:translation initiation factor 1A